MLPRLLGRSGQVLRPLWTQNQPTISNYLAQKSILPSTLCRRSVVTSNAHKNLRASYKPTESVRLPEPEPRGRRWSRYAAYTLIGTSVWGLCLLFAFNQQRLNSSVMSGALFAVQHDPAVVALLGDDVQLSKQYAWLPRPFVLGTLNQLHGQVDLAFFVEGQQGHGKVYFQSTRGSKTSKWTTQRFELELPDGHRVSLPSAEAMAEATKNSTANTAS
ncbi:cytochrome oxidase complex assembly protein 1-domain-containing protein [Syncephalis fuscata]|nr:cytochrome oxidase complex assembly protein 1-domain-containing protein [Syncephalis fuscata]